jgi:hypothetical protein
LGEKIEKNKMDGTCSMHDGLGRRKVRIGVCWRNLRGRDCLEGIGVEKG